MPYVKITTERGHVRVIAPECARRPCLHVHWSRHGETTDYPERGPKKGAKVVTFPLVCVRNEGARMPAPVARPISEDVRDYGVMEWDGLPFIPGVNCIHCGRFVGRDGYIHVEHFEMSSEIASVDGECRSCISERRAETCP